MCAFFLLHVLNDYFITTFFFSTIDFVFTYQDLNLNNKTQ